MSENTIKTFAELTVVEQSVVTKGLGWNGKTYTDVATGIVIELTDGDVAGYIVVDKGNQEVAETTPEVTEEVVAPTEEVVDTAPTDAPVPEGTEQGEATVEGTEVVEENEPPTGTGQAPQEEAPVQE